MTEVMRVELLADHPEAIGTLRTWFEREWAPYYGPAGPGDANKDLHECCGRDRLPIGLVALADGAVCGTAALKAESVPTHEQLTPWLAALLVLPEYRRRGVAERLITAVEEKAAELGFNCLYVGTGTGPGTPESALRKRDWEIVDKGSCRGSDVLVYKKTL